MQFCIDIGNTSSRVAIFNGRKLIHSQLIQKPEDWKAFVEHHKLSNIAVSNVSKFDRIPKNILDLDPLIVNWQTPMPVNIEYDTPETLGSDRICAAVGSHTLYPNNHVLCIDIGTCIKFELVKPNGTYSGGNIAPGMSMRFRSLNQGTARLPLVEPRELQADLGRSTEEAIRNGVQLGMICEMDAMIDRLKTLYPNLAVVMTGGDLTHFENALKTPIFAHPLLVLQGLNEIILFRQSIEA